MSAAESFYTPSEPKITGGNPALEQLGNSEIFLFDLDDTIARYDGDFIVTTLFQSLKDHTYQVSDDQMQADAIELHRQMNFGDKQKQVLEPYFDGQEIRTFWDSFTARFHSNIRPEHVTFDSRLVKFINFALRNELEVGVISNTTPDAGTRVLEYLNDANDIDLSRSATFLGSSSDRKPNPRAVDRFTSETGLAIDTSRTAYFGNSMSDLMFAKNTHMTPVLIDYGNVLSSSELTEMQKKVIADSIIITDFAVLKNFMERARPHYRRHISLSIERALSRGKKTDLKQEALCLDPTDDNLFRIATEGAAVVMEHVPSILRRFHTEYSKNDRFSIVDLSNYPSFFHEATGAIKIPPRNDIPEPYNSYFTANRIRQEGEHTFARGPNYYRQHIAGFNPAEQLVLVRQEITDALRLLNGLAEPGSNSDHIFKLAVQDNLRGNIQSIYLSIINALREKNKPENLSDFKTQYDVMGQYYEAAVELQYAHMLGLDYNDLDLLKRFSNIDRDLNAYSQLAESQTYTLKFKSPEVDNPIQIATRANELCYQYPQVNLLVGLSSGGVELACVSKLIARHKLDRTINVIHYPISVHHGQSMWSKDKDVPNNQPLIDSFFDIDRAKNKQVVVCEDNSNSGQTLERIIDRLYDAGASKVHFAVIEIDPTRILMHAIQQKAGAKHNIGQVANRTRPVVNYFHPDFIGSVGVVKILLSDQGFTKVIAIDTANKYSQE